MVLCFEKTLETIISSADEIKIAIDELRGRQSELIDRIEDAQEEPESISPVIEQQLDPDSYESTSYSIDVGYGSSIYDGTKNYYDLVRGENGAPVGASFTAVMNAYEHELLENAQEIQNQSRAGDDSNHPFVEAQADTNKKYIKEQIKLVSPGLWQIMYYGKIKFN